MASMKAAQQSTLPKELQIEAERVFGSADKARQWASTPLPALGGRCPVDVSFTAEGIGRVREVLTAVEHGVYV
jgi:uncharacterized protein (DUF2384 family)